MEQSDKDLKITLEYSRDKWNNNLYLKRAKNYEKQAVLKKEQVYMKTKILEMLKMKMYFKK